MNTSLNNSNISNNSQNSLNDQSKRFQGKRKCEFPVVKEENIYSKKMKTASQRSLSTAETGQVPTLIKSSLSKTALSQRPHLRERNNQNQNNNKISKKRITEGCLSNSLYSNIKSIIEKEKALDQNLKKLKTINKDTQLKILNEFAKKNLDLLELDYLMNKLDEFKSVNEEKKVNMIDNIASVTANKESVLIRLDRINKDIENLNTQSIHLQSKIKIKNDEVNEEEKKVKLFI